MQETFDQLTATPGQALSPVRSGAADFLHGSGASRPVVPQRFNRR